MVFFAKIIWNTRKIVYKVALFVYNLSVEVKNDYFRANKRVDERAKYNYESTCRGNRNKKKFIILYF